MTRYIIGDSKIPDEIDDEIAPMSTEPQVIYEEIELNERVNTVFDIIRSHEAVILRLKSSGPKDRKFNIEEIISIFKELYGFDCPQLSIRKVAKKYSVSAPLIGTYNNRILEILRKNDFIKSLKG